jgi:hypothetical protein
LRQSVSKLWQDDDYPIIRSAVFITEASRGKVIIHRENCVRLAMQAKEPELFESHQTYKEAQSYPREGTRRLIRRA